MTRPCPDCGSQISDRAKLCPHCGRKKPHEPPLITAVNDMAKGSFSFGCLCFLVLFLLALCGGLLTR